MDQRRHRRGALHRIGEPDIQRDLGALADCTHEEQEADQRQGPELRGLHGHGRGGVGHLTEVEGPEGEEHQEDAEHEAPVTHPVDDERLLTRIRRRLLRVPETDQQVGAQTHALPPHEHHQVVAAQHQREHEEAEEVQVAEEPRVPAARLVVHVGGRVDVNQEPDPGHDEDHQSRQRVEAERPWHLERAHAVHGLERDGGYPRGDGDDVCARRGRQTEELHERGDRQQQREAHRRAGDRAGEDLAEVTNPHEAVDGGANRGQQRNEPDQIHGDRCSLRVPPTIASRSSRRC